MLQQRLPAHVESVYIANPGVSPDEILHAIADELGLPPAAEGAPASALRDLQTYLKLSSLSEMDKGARAEHDQIWEHVKTLRRRVASLN